MQDERGPSLVCGIETEARVVRDVYTHYTLPGPGARPDGPPDTGVWAQCELAAAGCLAMLVLGATAEVEAQSSRELRSNAECTV